MYKVLSLLVVVLFASPLLAQVRIVQWSDAHSTLNTLPYQLQAIDQAARQFYGLHPAGEFIVFVNGDYTSLNPYSQRDSGQLSFDALKALRDRGYTVLFNVGNHDAFDWTGAVDGIELFMNQIEQLRTWGVVVLGANFKKPKGILASVLTPYYKLRTLEVPTAFVGMTIEVLIEKSNMSKSRSKRLFSKIENYENTLRNLSPALKQEGIEQLILGVHDSNERMAELIDELGRIKTTQIPVPLVMAGDDHVVTAYRHGASVISDGGSHGSINILDFDTQGNLNLPLRHVAISQEAIADIKHSEFTHGTASLNPRLWPECPELSEFSLQVKSFVEDVERSMGRVLVTTSGIKEHKKHLKKGRTELGQLLAESLVAWVKDLRLPEAGEPVIAMFNSSSYRFEEPIPKGPITELTFRWMYTFLNESAVYRLSGEDIEALFRSLQSYYKVDKGRRYTPQMNQSVQDKQGRLYILQHGQWKKIKKNTHYLVVFDGWLSAPRYGQGPQIEEWLSILKKNTPVASKIFQEIIMEYLPSMITSSEKFSNQAPVFCRDIF